MVNNILQKFTNFENVIAKTDQFNYLEEVLQRIKEQRSQAGSMEAKLTTEEQEEKLNVEANFEVKTDSLQEREEVQPEPIQDLEEAKTGSVPSVDTEDDLSGDEDSSSAVDTSNMKTLMYMQPSLYMKPNKFLIISWLKALRV